MALKNLTQKCVQKIKHTKYTQINERKVMAAGKRAYKFVYCIVHNIQILPFNCRSHILMENSKKIICDISAKNVESKKKKK